MQKGIVSALQNAKNYDDIVDKVSQVPADRYLSGLQAVMKQVGDASLIPAGPVEFMASGGLTPDDTEQIMELSLRDAHLAAMFETVPDLLAPESKRPEWKDRLAEDCHRLLKDRIVIK